MHSHSAEPALTVKQAPSTLKSHFLIAYYRHLTDAVSYSFVVDSWSGEVDCVLILNVPAKKVMKGGERTTINITSQMICVIIRINVHFTHAFYTRPSLAAAPGSRGKDYLTLLVAPAVSVRLLLPAGTVNSPNSGR